MEKFANDVFKAKYSLNGTESWEQCARRVAENIVGPVFPDLVEPIYELIRDRVFMPGGRYLYASGRKRQAVNNCFMLRAEDTRQGWADLTNKTVHCLMFGGGIGVDYSSIRPDGAAVGGLGGKATGPIALMKMVNEIGRGVVQGGSRRSAIYGSLIWNHPDVFKFIRAKDWPGYIRDQKEIDVDTPAPLDMTNISVNLDDDFFHLYHDGDEQAHAVYNAVVSRMLKTGEPGFSINIGKNRNETLRNACCELCSEDDSDVCNLGSVVLPKIKNEQHMERVVHLATAFLLAGTIVGELPYDKVYEVREKNRRLGLGIMGFAEWYAERGIAYGKDDKTLARLLNIYENSSTTTARELSAQLGISCPVKTRAIAPTGTISILAETTSGIEPFFAAAYKRRWLSHGSWNEEIVIDAAVQRLLDRGIPADWIEDAYDLADDPERRVSFQAWVQQYVDHAISSTLNIPPFEDQSFTPEKFGDMLINYLPRLRGLTLFPDGARGGQPLSKVDLQEALRYDTLNEETGNERSCVNGTCGL